MQSTRSKDRSTEIPEVEENGRGRDAAGGGEKKEREIAY